MRVRGVAAAAAGAWLGIAGGGIPWGARAQTAPVTAECVLQAAALQNVPAQIILGFLKTEGGRPGTESRNTNGSFDLGPMQVNDRVWVPVLARMHFGGDRARAYRAVRDHGCYNVHVGAWIYRQGLDAAGGDHAEAVGFYNSRTPVYKQRYQQRFAKNFMELFGPPRASREAEVTGGAR